MIARRQSGPDRAPFSGRLTTWKKRAEGCTKPVAKKSSPMSGLFAFALAKVLAETCDELFRGNLEGLADAQQREHGERAARLDHLPVAHAEVVGIHVFLAKLARDAQRSNAVAQGAKETVIAGRKVSAGAHSLRLPVHEQKEHEHRYAL
jgi:hypothetical protein